MIPSRELIALTRQLGSMMEAGVDILRALRVLRSQTDDAELVALYDRLTHDMRLGSSLIDALNNAPQAFSPFALSLVREGEARGDLAGAFYRIADYLQKEQEANAPPSSPLAASLPVANSQEPPAWLIRFIRRIVCWFGCWLVLILFIELMTALAILPQQWHGVGIVSISLAVCAALIWRYRERAPRATSANDQSGENQGKSTFSGSAAPADEATFE